jgi:RNA polymerase sigma-70 factor (ECF subfamily)
MIAKGPTRAETLESDGLVVGAPAESEIEDRRDESLVAAAREGDEAAFERLLSRHEGRVLRVLRLLGVPDSDREDVAQEIFVRVFRNLGRFRPGHSFSGWTYRITVNAAHDHRRGAARRRLREAGWHPGLDDAPDRAPGPAERVAGLDRARLLEAALAHLSERERAVFVLCELEGLATGAVARALGISGITVRRHLGRARRHLREVLAEV